MLSRCSKFLLSTSSSKNLLIVSGINNGNSNAVAGQLLRGVLFSSSPRVAAVKGVLCPRPQETINTLGKKFCKFKEAASKCPQSAKLECKPDPCPNRPCENEVKNPAEAYRQAMEDVRCKAKSLNDFVASESQKILGDLDARMIDMSKGQLAARSKNLAEMEQRVDEVEKLSLVCGRERRKEAYSIGLRINEKLQTWECENAAGRLAVNRRLAQLADCVHERTSTLVRLVQTCRGSCSRRDMLDCIAEAHKQATCIHDHAQHHAREEIKHTEAMKAKALDENLAEAEKFMRRFEVRARDFLKGLEMDAQQLQRSCSKKEERAEESSKGGDAAGTGRHRGRARQKGPLDFVPLGVVALEMLLWLCRVTSATNGCRRQRRREHRHQRLSPRRIGETVAMTIARRLLGRRGRVRVLRGRSLGGVGRRVRVLMMMKRLRGPRRGGLGRRDAAQLLARRQSEGEGRGETTRARLEIDLGHGARRFARLRRRRGRYLQADTRRRGGLRSRHLLLAMLLQILIGAPQHL
ncbi:unnamed protein product [Trichogramma brassicae]|uniref:Uncharacterized protein n=1 Tax=Trichogramma brassicae TaxID=86971 RepID=A0A6H5IZF1_9HYME|nr:unnamed protein product [Trichogramma brassicae]